MSVINEQNEPIGGGDNEQERQYQPFDVTVGPLSLRGRPMVATDAAYVYNSVVAEVGRFMPRPVVRLALDLLLVDPGVVRLVLCSPEDPDHIVGFLIATPGQPATVLHAATVKGGYRSQGVARWMLASVNIEQGRPFGYTLPTRDLLRAQRRGWTSVHIPTFSNADFDAVADMEPHQ